MRLLPREERVNLKHVLCRSNLLARPPVDRYFLPVLPPDCCAIDFP